MMRVAAESFAEEDPAVVSFRSVLPNEWEVRMSAVGLSTGQFQTGLAAVGCSDHCCSDCYTVVACSALAVARLERRIAESSSAGR